MNRFWHVLLALLPLALTPLLLLAIGDGILDFGGGEKDILLAFLWAAWAVLFAVSSIVLIVKGWAMRAWMQRSLAVASGGFLALWGMALVASYIVYA